MTTRGNLVTLILIITLGCSHAYVGRIIKAKILLGIMINTFFQNLPLSQVVIYHRKRGGTVFSNPVKFVFGNICFNIMLNYLLR